MPLISTYRNSTGQITGTVTTDANGMKTFRDGSGRTTGTATRDSNGRRHFVMPEAGPLARPQRRDAERWSRMSRRSRSRRPSCASSLAANTRRTAARFSRLTNGCAWNAVSAFANCGRGVALQSCANNAHRHPVRPLHCALMFAAFMIGHHFSISAFCNAPSTSGVCSSSGGSSSARSA